MEQPLKQMCTEGKSAIKRAIHSFAFTQYLSVDIISNDCAKKTTEPQ
jgi:hypothetical protein